MATYDLTTTTPSAANLNVGDILNCPFSGSRIYIKLPAGSYQLECWGAQGGEYGGYTGCGGKGGYAKGTLNIDASTDFYLYAGGQPEPNTQSHVDGGFNGGGGTNSYGGGGGGGSDVRIISDDYPYRVIVAGGGGGAGFAGHMHGGYGGGEWGGAGDSYYTPGDGTVTEGGYGGGPDYGGEFYTPGDFGFANFNADNGGGGGGGWFGGGSGTSASDDTGGGGGSGYVHIASHSRSNLNQSKYYLSNTINYSGSESLISPTGTAVTGNEGNGYVRITILSITQPTTPKVYIKTSSTTWTPATNIYVKTDLAGWVSGMLF